jgi:5-amino-6-(5-phosphoribosylamino)uracil reductase
VEIHACLIASLDGRISAAEKGGPQFGSRADRRRLFACRAWADALLLGAGTVRAEGFAPLIRDEKLCAAREANGMPAHPDAFVLTRSGRLPWHAPFFAPGPQRRTILCGEMLQPPSAHIGVHALGSPSGLEQALDYLQERGYRRLLVEGGGLLFHHLLGSRRLDRLHLTLAPLLLGGDNPLLLPRVSGPSSALKLLVCEQVGDELFLEYAPCS